MPASFDNGTNLETGGLSDVWWAICRPREFVLGGDESRRAGKAALERHRARHILTPPYTPRWNGKVERFIPTLKREWAYAHSWPSSTERTRALASFLRYYNRRRPHSWESSRVP
jgi:transposase InsO family protein